MSEKLFTTEDFCFLDDNNPICNGQLIADRANASPKLAALVEENADLKHMLTRQSESLGELNANLTALVAENTELKKTTRIIDGAYVALQAASGDIYRKQESELECLHYAVGAAVADKEALQSELDAYKRAKEENDERFQIERDEARNALRELQAENARLKADANRQGEDYVRLYKESRALQAEIDAAPVVYGLRHDREWYFAEYKTGAGTHRARLVRIEEIGTEIHEGS
jgi:chromosome segregation ATPase